MSRRPFQSGLERGRRPEGRARSGFTLVELVVATVAASILAMGTAASISMLGRAKGSAVARREAFARADAAATRLGTDLAAIVRAERLIWTRVRVIDGGEGVGALIGGNDEVLFYARSHRPMRNPDDASESGEYAVEYKIGSRTQADPEPCLWRRSNHLLAPDSGSGGVAMRVAEGVTSLSVEAHDGEAWVGAWDSDVDGLPHGVRVVVTARSGDGTAVATARRVIAVDRVPIPVQEKTSSDKKPGTGGGAT